MLDGPTPAFAGICYLSDPTSVRFGTGVSVYGAPGSDLLSLPCGGTGTAGRISRWPSVVLRLAACFAGSYASVSGIYHD